MLVYRKTKAEFLDDVKAERIEQLIENEIRRKLDRNSPPKEILSWKNSLKYMYMVLDDRALPDDAGVAIEYNIPQTNRRIDFILTGQGADRDDTAVIIELKQWQQVSRTGKDGIVSTVLGGGLRETGHPSYQAWSYAAVIEDYNETVRKEQISLRPCAYLHNLESRDAINAPFYAEHTQRAPVFISGDAKKLATFLKQHVRYGDSRDIMYRIEHGVIKPSKSLVDSLLGMLEGHREFVMLDEQKVVYETAIDRAHRAHKHGKQVLIVQGGPGTGKSVVAINLLAELTRREMLVQYVTRNAAPREVFKTRLTGSYKRTRIDNLFRGSGSYVTAEPDQFDALIVDEAHRLNEKSGLYGNLGEHQIKELINAARTTVFFLDEDQRVTFQDVGSQTTIEQFAREAGADVQVMALESQFRCNGSDGYLAWLDHALQIRPTANTSLEDIDYDFRVFDDPSALHQAIIDRNQVSNRARLVAGYCWDWTSKKDATAWDIELPEHNYRARWNLTEDGSLWLIKESSVQEVGCIHTCQGLEVDYIGVIIGDDFAIRDGQVVTDAGKRSRMDRSVRGYKKQLKADPETARARADRIIKNTYRTLMTRGMKGCYICCTDPETQAWFQQYARDLQQQPEPPAESYAGLNLPVVSHEDAEPYRGYVPVYDLAAAAGAFSPTQDTDATDWVQLPDHFNTREGMFVMRVVGESMNRRISSGAWCLFAANPHGTRNGRIVLVQHHDITDPDHGGSYTIKRYQSEKGAGEEGSENQRVVLSPASHELGYRPLVFDVDQAEELAVLAEFIAVIE